MGRGWIFHQEKNPKQTSKSTQRCVIESKLKILPWLSKSLTWGLIYKNACKILTKSVRVPESQKWRVPKNIEIYKTVCMPEPAQIHFI